MSKARNFESPERNRVRIRDETERVLPTWGPVPLHRHLYSFAICSFMIYFFIYFLAGRMPVPPESRTKRPTMLWSFSDVSAMC